MHILWGQILLKILVGGASFGYRKKLPMTKSLRDPSVYEMKVVREQIKNSKNRAYSSGTNFIAEICRGASFGYRKKLPMSKSLRNPSVYRMKVMRE